MSTENKTIETLLTQRNTICKNGELIEKEDYLRMDRSEYILKKLKAITELVDEITESLKLKKEEI